MPDISVILKVIQDQFVHIDGVQVFILVFGVAEVFLAKANNILLYPAGIVATALSIYSLGSVQLYAECLLNIYYVVMSVYGWWFWISKGNLPPIKITATTRSEWGITLGIVLGGWAFLSYVLATFTSSTVPFWDAWVSSAAWAGMWLLARRKVENWILLNISNAFAIPLLFYKELPLFALLTIFLFVVGWMGYRDWLRILKKDRDLNSKVSA